LIRAFFFIATRSFINRIVFRLRRLKQPRYAISALAAAAYFYFAVFQRGGPRRGSLPQTVAELGIDVFALLAGALLLLAWTLPNHAALEFSEAETHFLFSGPVTRRQALLYKIFRAQPTVLVTVLVFLFLRVPNGLGIGMWIVVTTISIYLTFIALVRARLRLAGVPGWVVTTVAAAVVGALGWLLYTYASDDVAAEAASPFKHPLSRAILFLPRLIPTLLFSKDPMTVAIYGAALAAAGAVLFFIGSSLRVPLEELVMNASAQQSARRLRVRARHAGQAFTIRRIKPLFALPVNASPEMAVAWKHLTAAVRMTLPWFLAIAILYAVLFTAGVVMPDEIAVTAFAMSVFLATWFPLAGSGLFAQDLRLDYRHFDVLRTWPISGQRLVGSAMVAPLVLTSALELMFIIGASILAHRVTGRGEAILLGRPEFVVLATLFAIPVCASQIAVRNAIPIVLPGWAGQSNEAMKGFVAMGQRLIALLLNLFVLFCMLLPAAVVAAVGYWVATKLFNGGPAVLALTAMPAVALLVCEVWLLITFLGAQFDKLDATSDLDHSAA
jgi:hypothetical protein